MPVHLREFGKDFRVVMRGKSRRTYEAIYELTPVENPPDVDLEKLKQYVERLNERYPERIFYLGKYKGLVVIGQRCINRKGERVKDRVPIYLDLERKKAYVPKTFLRRKYRRLTNYLLMRVLGMLGWAKPRYISIIH